MNLPRYRLALLLIPLVLACLAFSPSTQAVVPPPDGGYPGANTAEGDNALFSLRGGQANTAVGSSALFSNTNGKGNTAAGASALFSNTTGIGNTATGVSALSDNTIGGRNTASGANSLFTNTTGAENTANGYQTLFFNTIGRENTANGVEALFSNTTGDNNSATGVGALFRNTTGIGNTADGVEALFSNTSGERNIAIGFNSLHENTTGNFNVALGAGAGSGVITANNVICIGRGVAGANVSNTCFIKNIRGVTTQNANALPVVIDGAGQLGTVSSSQRFKHDIKPIGKASEGILALEPVTFHYKSDSANIPQFGLIAEEVEKVNPDLVVRDKNGEIYTVRYDAVNAMLLNEFLKEHRKTDKLEATIAQQQKQIEALTAGLQKVSAQLEVSKPAPQTVLNN